MEGGEEENESSQLHPLQAVQDEISAGSSSADQDSGDSSQQPDQPLMIQLQDRDGNHLLTSSMGAMQGPMEAAIEAAARAARVDQQLARIDDEMNFGSNSGSSQTDRQSAYRPHSLPSYPSDDSTDEDSMSDRQQALRERIEESERNMLTLNSLRNRCHELTREYLEMRRRKQKQHKKLHARLSRQLEEEVSKANGIENVTVPLCVVCQKNVVEYVHLPCRHLVTCGNCQASIDRCKVCESQITLAFKIYIQ